MSTRIDFAKAAPQAAATLFNLERHLHGCGLEAPRVQPTEMPLDGERMILGGFEVLHHSR
jgi:hypothetical protein